MPGDKWLKKLMNEKEGQLFDRKDARIMPRELAEHVVGMANADGGTITITGMDRYPDKINRFLQVAKDYTKPIVKFDYRLAEDTLILKIYPSERVHATTKDDVYLRVGDQTRKLTFDERLQLQGDKGEISFEATLVDASLKDLDKKALTRYKEHIDFPGTMEDLLLGRDLAVSKDNEIVLNYAAILLFAKHPTRWLPRAEVRFL